MIPKWASLQNDYVYIQYFKYILKLIILLFRSIATSTSV